MSVVDVLGHFVCVVLPLGMFIVLWLCARSLYEVNSLARSSYAYCTGAVVAASLLVIYEVVRTGGVHISYSDAVPFGIFSFVIGSVPGGCLGVLLLWLFIALKSRSIKVLNCETLDLQHRLNAQSADIEPPSRASHESINWFLIFYTCCGLFLWTMYLLERN